MVALLWLWWVDGVTPSRWDILGVSMALAGTLVILAGARLAASS